VIHVARFFLGAAILVIALAFAELAATTAFGSFLAIVAVVGVLLLLAYLIGSLFIGPAI
jgi:hypothetical protein